MPDHSPSLKLCIMLMSIHCWTGIRQRLCSHLSVFNKDVPCPLCCSPSAWTIHSIANGVTGAPTGSPDFLVTHMLFADDLSSCPMTSTTCRLCWTTTSVCTKKVSYCQYTKVWGDVLQLSHQQSAPSLLWWRAAPLHGLLQMSGHSLWQTYQSEYCSRCSAKSIYSWYFLHQVVYTEHDLASRLHAYVWLRKTYAIPAGMYASQVWATPFLQ